MPPRPICGSSSVAGLFGAEARKGLSEAEDLALGRRYLKARFDAGYAGINWSPEFGGQGLTPIEKIAFETEELKYGMPSPYFGISLGMPVPIMMKFCEDKAFVRERVIKAMQGEEIWCQLFSEPAAGSDLAGLRLRAETGRKRLETQRPEAVDLLCPPRRLRRHRRAHRSHCPEAQGADLFLGRYARARRRGPPDQAGGRR